MSDPNQITVILVPFVIQPVLLGIYARKDPRRSAILWGILAFAINVAIITFFETHMSGQLFGDAAAEVGTTIIISTIFVLVILVLRQNGPQATAEKDYSINLRRGLFRIWALISGSWIIFCAIEFLQNCNTRWACGFFASGLIKLTYFDNGKWFTGPPALVFMIGLAACWVVEGFRRSAPS